MQISFFFFKIIKLKPRLAKKKKKISFLKWEIFPLDLLSFQTLTWVGDIWMPKDTRQMGTDLNAAVWQTPAINHHLMPPETHPLEKDLGIAWPEFYNWNQLCTQELKLGSVRQDEEAEWRSPGGFAAPAFSISRWVGLGASFSPGCAGAILMLKLQDAGELMTYVENSALR